MTRLLPLVVAEGEVEPRHRNPPAVHCIRVDVHVALVVRDHLPAPGQANATAVFPADPALQLRTVPRRSRSASEAVGSRHPEAAAHLDVVATRKIKLVVAVPQPPRSVQVRPSEALRVIARQVLQGRQRAAQTEAHCVHQIASHQPGAVGDPIGKGLGLGIEHQPSRLARRSRQHHRAAKHALLASGAFVDVDHARGESLLVDGDLADHRIGDHR